MSDDSPLFVSAIELLAHATELYRQGNERKYKFVVLHLANAIELILKDRLIDAGVSIYQQKRSQTISIWDSFDKLQKQKVNIPERPIMELLIDDRNTIQHRFGFPDAETVYFYLKRVVAFFRRFLDDEYGVALVDVLKPYLDIEHLAFLGLVEDEESEIAELDKLFEISPESAVLQAYNIIEKKVIEALDDFPNLQRRAFVFWRSPEFRHLLDWLATEGYVAHDTVKEFHFLREMRNRAAHAAHFPDDSPEQWEKALQIAKDLICGLERAFRDGRLPRAADDEDGHSQSDNSDEATG